MPFYHMHDVIGLDGMGRPQAHLGRQHIHIHITYSKLTLTGITPAYFRWLARA